RGRLGMYLELKSSHGRAGMAGRPRDMGRMAAASARRWKGRLHDERRTPARLRDISSDRPDARLHIQEDHRPQRHRRRAGAARQRKGQARALCKRAAPSRLREGKLMAARRAKRRRDKGSGSVTFDKSRNKFIARLPDTGIGTPPKKQFDTEDEADAWLAQKL